MKDSSRFMEIALSDVRYTSHAGNSTNKTVTGRDEYLTQIEILVQSLILVLAVFGNSCVLAVLTSKRKVTSRMYLLIFHLSVADLLVAVFNILPQLIWDITGTFQGGEVLCRYIKFMQIYVMYLSTYMLVMIAIDRYCAVCHPLSAVNSSSKTAIYVMVSAAYVISGIFSLPQLIIFKIQEPEIGSGVLECWVNFDPPWTMHVYVISFTFVIYIVPLILLMFAYMSICRAIWRKHRTTKLERLTINNFSSQLYDISLSTRNIYSSYMANRLAWRNEQRPNMARRRQVLTPSSPRVHPMRGFSRAKMKTIQLTFVVILAYILCWSPFFVSQLWWLYDASQENNEAVVVMILLGSLNSCCNPWIYMAFRLAIITCITSDLIVDIFATPATSVRTDINAIANNIVAIMVAYTIAIRTKDFLCTNQTPTVASPSVHKPSYMNSLLLVVNENGLYRKAALLKLPVSQPRPKHWSPELQTPRSVNIHGKLLSQTNSLQTSPTAGDID